GRRPRGRLRGRPLLGPAERGVGPARRWVDCAAVSPSSDQTEVSRMSKYLSQEWLDEGRKLAEDQPVRPGATAKMQYVVTGGPDGDIKYYWVLEDGKLLESQLGEIADGDFTLTMTFDDANKVHTGQPDPHPAFMEGR